LNLLAKYPRKIISLRNIAIRETTTLLKKKSLTLGPIYEEIKKKYSEDCDESVICNCGDKETSRAEWKHQVRWALQDLRYTGKINYSKKTREYSMK